MGGAIAIAVSAARLSPPPLHSTTRTERSVEMQCVQSPCSPGTRKRSEKVFETYRLPFRRNVSGVRAGQTHGIDQRKKELTNVRHQGLSRSSRQSESAEMMKPSLRRLLQFRPSLQEFYKRSISLRSMLRSPWRADTAVYTLRPKCRVKMRSNRCPRCRSNRFYC